MKNRNIQSTIIYLLLLFMGCSLLMQFFGNSGNDLTYSQVVELFRLEQVRSFEVVGDEICLELYQPVNGESVLYADLADAESFRQEMWQTIQTQQEAGILVDYHFKSEHQPTPMDWVLPLLIVGLLVLMAWFFLMSRLNANNPAANFGKARTVLGIPDGQKVTFDDVAGADEEKAELQETVDFLRDPAKYTQIGARIPHGLLLVGPSAPALLALIGILITIVLYIKKVPASVFIGLIITAIIGVIFTAAGFGVGGDIFMPALPKEIISFSFDTTVLFGFASGFGELFSTNPLDLIMILFSFLFFIFFDTTGTLISLAQSAGFPEDENGEFKGIKNAFIGDAVGGLIGVILGTSPQTAYVESSTGIGVGGRTGLTAVFTGIFFLIAIVFSPLILSLFTSPVTACALVMVGILMMGQLKEVEWDNLVSVAAVFATIVMMLLTYSITLGIAFGFVTYAVAAIADGKAKEMHPLVWVLIIIFAIYLFFGL